MEHSEVASRVLAAVGGKDNIQAAAHCATRLRLVLVDQGQVDQAALDNDPDVKGTFLAGGMYQIIIGPGDVDVVFEHLVKDGGVVEVSKDDAKQVAAQQDNPLVRLIKTIADIFVPILPALIAGGLMMAINNVLTAEGLFGEKSVVGMFPAVADYAAMINMISSAAFSFLPVLVGYSAAKRFGANVYLGAAMGAAMVSPELTNAWNAVATQQAGELEYWNVFGLQVAQVGYQAQVIPVLVVTWLLSVIEKRCHKIFKGTADFLLSPLITMLLTGFLAFVIVGPITRIGADGITDGLQWLYTHAGVFGGMVFGLLYSPIVVTGLHQSFPAVELPLIADGVGSFIFPIASMANVAQGAACLAVFLKARDAKLKGISGASAASALFGITEPAIFGVNLRLRWPFFIGLGCAGIGGALIALFKVRAVALGAAGLIGFVSIRTSDIVLYLTAMAITFALSLAANMAYASTRGKASLALAKADATTEQQEAALVALTEDAPVGSAAATAAAPALATPVALPDSAAEDRTVTAPVAGQAIALDQVDDATFASGMLGKGMAIVPSQGPVVSPVDGTVMVAFPTAHAYALRAASGVEVLIHIGMDTVQLQGQHFTPRVVKGQQVRRGDVLAEVDWAAVAAAGYDLTTPVVISNTKKMASVETVEPGQVAVGDQLVTAVAKPPKQPTA
ncbi:sucrose-specific PTS transporter subunit IIBC [Luteococcus sp. OSA5]|uniref:sucrose-specific PTS transporter subunit IIBC n=1 Tax=Luteococcus sp. OSA5 TaxID=3401630 RepID=UPI003B42B05A